MTEDRELFNRLDRICADHKKTLQLLYEDGGKEAVVDYVSALCAAFADVCHDNSDWKLAMGLAQVCSTTAKLAGTLALAIRLNKP